MFTIKTSKKGMTLPELMIGISIFMLIMGGTLTVYIMSITAWHEGSTQIYLQRDAALAMERMVRGVSGRNGLREADTVTPLGNGIAYRSAIDAVERSFYLNVAGDTIMYDPDTLIGGDEYAITDPNVRNDGIVGLAFFYNADLVTIHLQMRDTVKGKNIDVYLTTSVKIRN